MFSELLKGSKVLNKDEMKNVTGGDSSPCPPGEKLYTCTVTYENGNSFSGKACGSSPLQAEDRTQAEHDIDGGVKVKCS